jgi:type I restriction enzyme S subunit
MAANSSEPQIKCCLPLRFVVCCENLIFAVNEIVRRCRSFFCHGNLVCRKYFVVEAAEKQARRFQARERLGLHVRRNEERKWAQPRGLRFFWRDCRACKESAAEMIAGVKKMSVPKGFKQTEVGIIPQDWEVSALLEVVNVIDGDRGVNYPSKSDLKPTGYCLFLNAGNVTKKGFAFAKNEFIEKDKHISLHNGTLARNDIVLTTRGTVGNFAYFHNFIPFDVIRINSGMVLLRINTNLCESSYLYCILTSNIISNQITRLSFGSAQSQLTVSGIKRFLIPIPPTRAEQTAIAAALSDMDALIESVEKLLKKRRIKQGAMQELLRPKEGWKEVQLDSVADIDNDNLSSSSDPNFTFQYISLEDVDNGLLKGTTEMMFKDAPSRARRRVKQGDVLISTVRPNLKSHLIIKENLKNYICSTGFSLIRCDKGKLTPGYLFNHLFASFINQQIDSVISGSNYPAINTSHVKSLKIPIPTRIKEQEEIAAILSDMDSEIEQLETQLTKYRKLKIGMMQELLTGKKRLV